MANPKGSGKGGRPKSTDRRKQILGERKDRISSNAEQVNEFDFGVDDFQGLGDIGEQVKKRYSEILINARYVTVLDSVAFHLFCSTFEQWVEAEEKIKSDGKYMKIIDKLGNEDYKEAPWSKVASRTFTQLIQIMRELGMTPQSRSTLKIIAENKEPQKIKSIT